jgi:hypothetical protein
MGTPRQWSWISVPALVLSCVTPRAASPELLVARASFDLGCAPASLSIHAFDPRTRAVMGCGQRATYVEDCRAPGRPCTWVADVGPTAMPAAPAQVATATAPIATAAQWPAQTPPPAATASSPPQALPGNHAFRSEEDYGF